MVLFLRFTAISCLGWALVGQTSAAPFPVDGVLDAHPLPTTPISSVSSLVSMAPRLSPFLPRRPPVASTDTTSHQPDALDDASLTFGQVVSPVNDSTLSKSSSSSSSQYAMQVSGAAAFYAHPDSLLSTGSVVFHPGYRSITKHPGHIPIHTPFPHAEL